MPCSWFSAGYHILRHNISHSLLATKVYGKSGLGSMPRRYNLVIYPLHLNVMLLVTAVYSIPTVDLFENKRDYPERTFLGRLFMYNNYDEQKETYIANNTK